LASPKRQMVAGGDSARLRGKPRMSATCDWSRPISRSKSPADGAGGGVGVVSCGAVGSGGAGDKGVAAGGIPTSAGAGGRRARVAPGGGGLRGGGSGNGAAAMGGTLGLGGADPASNAPQPANGKTTLSANNAALPGSP
jgi:hypothetical protein